MFRGRRGRLLMGGAFLLVIGVLGTWLIRSEPVSYKTFIVPLLIPIGLFQLQAAWRRLPRLVVAPDRIIFHSLLNRSTWAGWDSIGRFETTVLNHAPVARAPIVGANISDNLIGKKEFTFTGPLDQPWADILAEVERRQAKRSPAISPAPLQSSLERHGSRVPWLSLLLIWFFVAVFFIETRFPMNSDLDVPALTLLTLGALNHEVILATGEWTRLATAAVLHSGISHLVLNCIGLVFSGLMLESVIGRVWYLCIFVVSCLVGSFVSFELGNATAVGASTGIMGLFAASLVVSFRMKSGNRVRSTSLQFLLPALFGVFAQTAGIDHWGHAGGALGGLIVSLILLQTWNDRGSAPPYRGLAASAAAAGIALLLAGAVVQTRDYPIYRDLRFVPKSEKPPDEAGWRSEVRRLIAAYPMDMEPHTVLAALLENDKSYLEAEVEARRSLEIEEVWRMRAGFDFDRTWEVKTAKAILAQSLYHQGKVGAASLMAQDLCADPKASFLTEANTRWFHEVKLCP